MTLRIERYKHTRHWALYDGSELVAVTVYRRGAQEVRRRLAAQPRAAADAAAEEVAQEAAAQQAQELAAQACALAQQAQAAAQAVRPRAQPSGHSRPPSQLGRATAPGWPPRPMGAPPLPTSSPRDQGFGARSTAARGGAVAHHHGCTTRERCDSRACLEPACRAHLLVTDVCLPARDGRRAGVWGEGPHDPQQNPPL